jgi:hypothetical protein
MLGMPRTLIRTTMPIIITATVSILVRSSIEMIHSLTLPSFLSQERFGGHAGYMVSSSAATKDLKMTSKMAAETAPKMTRLLVLSNKNTSLGSSYGALGLNELGSKLGLDERS